MVFSVRAAFFLYYYLVADIVLYVLFFFFKHKPAYDLRISDWSSDVCSSDLPSQADDLVQGALTRALSNLDKFEVGTNLRAWMFTILRNLYYSELRKRRREVEDTDGGYAAMLATQPNQIASLELKDFRRALAQLPPEQREALVLIGASGFSYEDAAHISSEEHTSELQPSELQA